MSGEMFPVRIEIITRRVYLGANRYSGWPAVHYRIRTADELFAADLRERLFHLLEQLLSNETLMQEPLTEWRGQTQVGAWPIVQLAITLQNLAGARLPATACELLDIDNDYSLLCGYETAEVAENALRLALEMTLSSHRITPKALVRLRQQVTHFFHITPMLSLDQTTAAIMRAAQSRGIPVHRLSPAGRFVRLGQGRHQRKIFETWTSETPVVGMRLASNKLLASELLDSVGVPVANHIVLGSPTPQGLRQIATELGFPLVVKPLHGMQGKGVVPRIISLPQLEQAVRYSQQCGFSELMVESFVEGDEHRLLVVAGRLIAAAQRIPAHVIGDGTHTITQLIELANRDPRRGRSGTRVLELLRLDAISDTVLARQGLTREGVPERGQHVQLRNTSNVSTGGTGVDVTDEVHPEVRAMAEVAARVMELDIAGIDYITPDISRPWHEVGGAVIEVNSCPGLRPHWSADGGRRDVVSPILEHLCPPGRPLRIPTAAITGSIGKTTTSRMVQRILMQQGLIVGMVCTDGIYVQEQLQRAGDFAGGGACQMVYNHPSVNAAVFETARGGLIRRGLGFDLCDVAAVLNIDDEHIGQDGIASLEEMAELKATVLSTAHRAVVLNGEDTHCMGMLKQCAPPAILFATNPQANSLVHHLTDGGEVVTIEDTGGERAIVIRSRERSETVLPLSALPAFADGRLAHNLRNALAATAIAHGMGIAATVIARGLGAFHPDLANNPGRLSFFHELPFTVVIDLPVNRTTIKSMCEAVCCTPHSGRRLLAMTAAGNRRDEHISAMAEQVAPHFDHFILFSWDDLRGRTPEAIPDQLAAALRQHGVTADRISVVYDQAQAYHTALSSAAPGDLLVLHCLDNGRRRDALLHLLRAGTPFAARSYRDYIGQRLPASES